MTFPTGPDKDSGAAHTERGHAAAAEAATTAAVAGNAIDELAVIGTVESRVQGDRLGDFLGRFR